MQPETNQQEQLQGLVERVTFHNPDNGYAVLKVNVKNMRDLVTVIGHTATITVGEYISCTGTWIVDRQFGQQFKAASLTFTQPNTKQGMEKYLGSGVVKGIGPSFAKRLMDAFGEDVFDVIENDPDRLDGVEGIGKKRKNLIVSGWSDQRNIREIMVFLQSHGVGTARAVRIYKTYGVEAIKIVTDNPYRLAQDIHGVGFKTADQLALRIGIEKHSLIRAQAGVRYVLQELSTLGHCAVYEPQLVNKSVELLQIKPGVIVTAIDKEIGEKNLIAETDEQGRLLFLKKLHAAEVSVANHLKRLNEGAPQWQSIDVDAAIPWVEEQTGVQLSSSQRTAVGTAIVSNVSVITGGPGVGKTTVVNSILKIVRSKGASVLLCAPTGRAAKRMTESTGLTAKTIHRLLDFDPVTRQFKHDSDNPLAGDCVIVDEASMIDIVLMHQLVRAIPSHAALIIVGDTDQLPSVGPGAVLHDVIASEQFNTVVLTEIFRQAASSKIIVNAHRVNEGKLPVVETVTGELTDFYFIPTESSEAIVQKILEVVTNRIPKRFGLNAIRDVQVLSPMHRGDVGVRGLNEVLQATLNKASEPKITRFGSVFALGDKVMQTTNNYDKDVFNGDVGFIQKIDMDDSVAIIDFDDRVVEYYFDEFDELVLAYACSIHKSQGSEYPAVVIPVTTSHFMMLQRNLLYTGITRGKKLVVLIGQQKALRIAVNNIKALQRISKLKLRLASEYLQ